MIIFFILNIRVLLNTDYQFITYLFKKVINIFTNNFGNSIFTFYVYKRYIDHIFRYSVMKNYCQECPNYFECPLKQFSQDYREANCLIYDEPPSYSATICHSRKKLAIPENPFEWHQRLQGFLNASLQ